MRYYLICLKPQYVYTVVSIHINIFLTQVVFNTCISEKWGDIKVVTYLYVLYFMSMH